jgi:glyoxylase-like metal-dependent hydrolase (beta-lactamase superfamily II)
MKPVSEVHQFAPGAFYWEAYSAELKTDLSCAAWRDENLVTFIDPVPLTMGALDQVARRAGRGGVLLTNANHERAAVAFHKKLFLEIYAHRAAEGALHIELLNFFDDGDMLPSGLRAIHLPGSSPSETAFYTPKNGGIVFMGDALVNMESLGGLAFLPDKYSENPAQSRESLRKLLALEFEMMTFAHGRPIVKDARKRVAALLGDS